MADKPKAAAKPVAPSGPSVEAMILGAIGLFVLIFLIVVPAVLTAFNIDGGSLVNLGNVKELFITFVAKVFTTVTFLAVFLTLIFVVLLLYVSSKKNRLMQMLEDGGANALSTSTHLASPTAAPENTGYRLPGQETILPGSEVSSVHGPVAAAGNEKWMDVEAKINSANQSDWRLAILEADILLYDMLDQMGIPGANLGEKLKSADPSFFSTLNEAWTAHKIRNVIAHEGSSYNLTYSEGRRAIDLYRRVFEEFYFI